MYDGPDMDAELLARGERYSGQRKPSLILEALLPDLMWLQAKALEEGFGIIEASQPYYEGMAWHALCLREPDFDVTIADDDDEGWLGCSEAESLVVARVIAELLRMLDDYTPAYTDYGWLSDDPDDEDYERLGVWINWDKIDTDLETGALVRIDEPDLDYEEAQRLHHTGAEAAIWDEDGEFGAGIEVWQLRTHELAWSLD